MSDTVGYWLTIGFQNMKTLILFGHKVSDKKSISYPLKARSGQ